MKYERLEQQPDQVDIKLTPDLFIKTVLVHKAGTLIPQHSHKFSHVSLLSVGRMRVWVDDVLKGEYAADPMPKGILIHAGVKHRFETLTDGVVFSCIHALHGTEDIEILAEHQLDFEGES